MVKVVWTQRALHDLEEIGELFRRIQSNMQSIHWKNL